MLIVIAASGLAWMLLALVIGLVLGATTRLRDRCGVPVVSAQPTVEAAENAAAAST